MIILIAIPIVATVMSVCNCQTVEKAGVSPPCTHLEFVITTSARISLSAIDYVLLEDCWVLGDETLAYSKPSKEIIVWEWGICVRHDSRSVLNSNLKYKPVIK